MTDMSPPTVRSIAEAATPEASRYLQQLCKHFQHKRPATFDERSGHIDFPIGECRLSATDDVLTISLSAPDDARMAELQDVVARHLLRFAFRDPPKIEWRAARHGGARSGPNPSGPTGVSAGHADRQAREAAPLNPFGPIRDPKVRAVIERLHASRRRPPDGDPNRDGAPNPADFADYGFSIEPTQGDLIYLFCRSIGARRVVDFATSVGMSALYFACAMRDNGGGQVIGSELVPAKAETARRNLADAGLESYVDIRVGDARTTLRGLGGPVDFALIDGWPTSSGPSLAREVIEIVAPQLRVGGYVLNDNAEPDFLDFIRNPANGFLSMTLPIKRGTELALKVQ